MPVSLHATINANVSINTAQTNAALTAIVRWNEVAYFNRTAGSSIFTHTPGTITGGGTPAIPSCWADVDARNDASGGQPPPICVNMDSTLAMITVTWPGVDHFGVTTTGHMPGAN